MDNVELQPSFRWDCPDCGLENHHRDDDIPDTVLCLKCDREFGVIVDDIILSDDL